MSLKITAQHLANQGRGNDSSLVHMSPREISALNDLARTKGQNLTINPQTGLPEAGLLEDLLPAVVGGALNYFAPGVGTAVGGLFGLGGAAGTGIAVGALSGLASGNLGKGLMAGLGAYGGAGVTEGIAGLGMGNIGREAVESATSQGLQGEALQQSVAQRMADVPMSEKFGAGINYFRDKPMDAAKVLGKSALTAAAPIFAGQGISESVPTTTPRPSPQGYIRRSTYDPYRQEFRGEEPYEAANGGLMSVASGGAAYADGGTVGYADGGSTYTPEQITSAINASRQQGFSDADVATGLGRFLSSPDAVAAALAANPINKGGTSPAALAPQAAIPQAVAPQAVTPQAVVPQAAATSAVSPAASGAANIVNPDIYGPFGGASAYSNPLVGGFGAAAPQAVTPQAATVTPAATGATGGAKQTYSPAELSAAIASARNVGATEDQIVALLTRSLPDQNAVAATLAANPKTATTQTTSGQPAAGGAFTPAQISSAINTSRQQGFSDSDIAIGLARHLPTPSAVAAAMAANPKTTTGQTYTPEQIKSAIDISRQQGFSEADVATGLGRYITDPAAVTSALAANPKTYTPEQIKSAIDISRQQGFSEADVATGLGRFLPSPAAVAAAMAANPKTAAYNPATQSTAEYWATQPGWLAERGDKTGIPGLNQNIANYAAKITPATVKTLGLSNAAAVEARIRADMKATGASDADVLRATGKTVAQIAAGAFPTTTPVTPVTPFVPVGPVTPSVPTSITTTDKNTLAEGVSGSTGAGIVGGGTVVNPNGTITVSPRIPGIPVGGFTGMEQVRNAYTAGGGKLGITPSFVPKTVAEMNARYANTGDSKAMYDYLTGKGPYPIKTGTQDPAGAIREVARPYSEAVLGMPAKANKPYIWNPTKGEYSKNPDYVRQEKIKNAEGKLVTRNFMSLNQVKSALNADQKLTGNSLVAWAKRNNVDQDTLADALGVSVFDVQKMFLDADEVGAAKNGGLMSLAKGGLAYAAGGGIEDVTDPATGEKYIYDYREGGRFRKAIVVKDGVTYKWNPVTKKYEVTSGNAGVDTLMNNQTAGPEGFSGDSKLGPGQFSSPDWGMAASLGAKLSDMGMTSLGGGISQQAREGRTAQQQSPTDVQDSSRDDTTGPIGNLGGLSPLGSGMMAGDKGYSPNAPATDSVDPGDTSGVESAARGGIMRSYAQGGLGSLGGYSDGGQLLRGPGDGVSDNIPATIGGKQPARLADGEFVVSADVVSGLGNGSTEAGARKLYAMMDRVRKARTGTKKMGRTIHPEKFIPS